MPRRARGAAKSGEPSYTPLWFPAVVAPRVFAKGTRLDARSPALAPNTHSRLRLPWEECAATAPLIDPSTRPALALHLRHEARRLTTYYQTLDCVALVLAGRRV